MCHVLALQITNESMSRVLTMNCVSVAQQSLFDSALLILASNSIRAVMIHVVYSLDTVIKIQSLRLLDVLTVCPS